MTLELMAHALEKLKKNSFSFGVLLTKSYLCIAEFT